MFVLVHVVPIVRHLRGTEGLIRLENNEISQTGYQNLCCRPPLRILACCGLGREESEKGLLLGTLFTERTHRLGFEDGSFFFDFRQARFFGERPNSLILAITLQPLAAQFVACR